MPNFKYNSKGRNSWIVNRVPDYGDGHRDGCIIMGELSVNLVEEDRMVSGQVYDESNNESMAYVQIIVNWGSESEIQYLADSQGKFTFKKTDQIENVTFSSIGYRTLKVRFPCN